VEAAEGTLIALQRDVERALRPLAFEPERRGYHPHLTLGRVRKGRQTGELEALGAYVERARVRVGTMRAESVHLIRSDLLPGGAVYSDLAAAPLTGTAAQTAGKG
jgi:2'-5' RNA ligase